jgi:hypothetical protein
VDVEVVEMQLDRIIEKRAREAGDAARVSELWAEQERADRDRRREEHAAAWHSFHRHMQELHATLSEEHRGKAEALLGEGAS